MALTFPSRPSPQPKDPTAALIKALRSFEGALTDEQKTRYRSSCARPDASSVLEFVAQIDASNKGRANRCVAPRLCTFLDKAQQFAGVVDTFVSSNPAIAALVWGGIKTTILSASNVASYFDRVTSMIMNIGRICPTYQEFGTLYPGSVGLQNALCEYYAAIIRLCIKIIEVSQRSALTHTFSSIFNPFESEFKQYQDELDRLMKDVELQISLASKQADFETARLMDAHRRENSSNWRSALRFQQNSRDEYAEAQQWRIRKAARDAAKMRSAVRANLSTLNHAKPWKQAIQLRAPNTADWFNQDPAFQDWKDDRSTAILWCSGKLGVGKTVIVSNVVAYLHMERKQSEIISYYFCRSDHHESLQARNIIGSLALQLLDIQIEHVKDDLLIGLYKDSKDLDSAEMVHFLLSRLEHDKTYYILLDGLDECENREIEKIAQLLNTLCKNLANHLKVLCSGRPELEIDLFKKVRPQYRITLAGKSVDSDIERYIDIELDQRLERNELKLGDPSLILKIAKALREGSHGMFLWTRLLIEEICIRENDNSIVKALDDIPHELSDLFERKWKLLCTRNNARKAKRVLQFCGVAKRPLSIEEIREALSVEPGQKSLDRGSLSNDIGQIIVDCCGLVFVDEEEATVHFIHNNVKTYLIGSQGPHSEEFIERDLELNFGYLCMTYLDFNDFKRQVAKVKHGSTAPMDPLRMNLGVVFNQFKVSNQVAQQLLRQTRRSRLLTTDVFERNAQVVLGSTDASRLQSELQTRQFPFLQYARKYWIYHLHELDNSTSETIWKLFCKFIVGTDVPASRPWVTAPEERQNTHGKMKNTDIEMEWIMANRHNALLLYHALVDPRRLTEDLKRQILRRAAIEDQHRYVEIIIQHTKARPATLSLGLQIAAAEGRASIVTILVEAGADINAAAANRLEGRTTLQAATEGGHLKVVERLLAAQADFNAATAERGGRRALQEATESGHLEMVTLLLVARTDVNTAAAEWGGRTALQAAAEGGHLEIVEQILAAGADVNAAAANSGGRTALQAAAGGGHLEVVERLLVARADINTVAAEWGGRTALQAAAEGGHLEVVERLLAARADVNAAAARWEGRTALQAAAEGDHLVVVERLLTAQANINAAAVEGRGRTALQAAAEGGHLEVVERLLVSGADANAAAAHWEGRTALQAAAGDGRLEVVERLLVAQADVNAAAVKGRGRTALQAAAEGGHLEVVERLLAARADINTAATCEEGRTALQAAAGGGHFEVVERLLAAHADINAAAADGGGRTALQAAAGGGYPEVVELLLTARANINAAAARLEGRTALQAAAGEGHLEVVERLLAARANINAAAAHWEGRTALQAAAEGGHLEVVARLLAARADVNAAPARWVGLTAVQAAAAGGHTVIVETLKTAGALFQGH